jgi:small subunit ribosomal protein S8e
MAVWHGERGRKITGGLIQEHRKKRKYELGRLPTHPKIGKEKKEIVRTKGGGKKVRLQQIEFANVLDASKTFVKKVKILDVLENPANPQWTRSKIITKGTIIETELGNAKVTSRPTQHGVVNAVAIQENEKEK